MSDSGERIIAGIDPGLDGGIVILARNARLLAKFVMPTIEVKGKKVRREVADEETGQIVTKTLTVTSHELDIPSLKTILRAEYEDCHIAAVFIEEAQVMSKPRVQVCKQCGKVQGLVPTQGAKSIFTTGANYRWICGLIAMADIALNEIHPKTWQGEMLFPGTGNTKARARIAVGKLFPTLDLRATERSKVPHEGIVDAMLIGAYGQRVMGLDYEIDKELGF